MMPKAYIICPVRGVSEEVQGRIDQFASTLEKEGWDVHNPKYCAPQDDPTGYVICSVHKEAMLTSDRVFIIWDVNSKGSHFDLGMAFAMGKPITLVECIQGDGPDKSYVKVMREMEKHQSLGA